MFVRVAVGYRPGYDLGIGLHMLPRSIGIGRRVFTPEVTGSIPVGSAKARENLPDYVSAYVVIRFREVPRLFHAGIVSAISTSAFQADRVGLNPTTRSIYAVSSNGKTAVS
jgi:hypothetical protein